MAEEMNEDLQPRRLDFRSLLRDLAIALVLAWVVCAGIYFITGNELLALYLAGGSLISLLIFGGVVAYRARQHFGGERGND